MNGAPEPNDQGSLSALLLTFLLSGLLFLCWVTDKMETVQRQLRLTPLKIEGMTNVSPNWELSDFMRCNVYESALQNKVLPKCKSLYGTLQTLKVFSKNKFWKSFR